jgi:hypothetical protein
MPPLVGAQEIWPLPSILAQLAQSHLDVFLKYIVQAILDPDWGVGAGGVGASGAGGGE